jgi:diguanylate cyclase (GGDEF)-like protein
MTEVQRGRTAKGTHPRRWLLSAALLPLAAFVTALAGGRVGRSVALSCVGTLAIAAIAVAQRRRGGRTPTTYQVPPAQVMAVAVVAFVAAEALGLGGVAENRGSIGDWTGVAAAIAALVGVWAFLAARVRERALDMVLEGALGALSLGVVFWSVTVEPSLANGNVNGSMAAAHVTRAGLALIWVIAAARLERLSTSERLAIRLLGLGAVLVFIGECVGTTAVVIRSGSAFVTPSIALTTAGLLLTTIALLHPTVSVEPPFVRTVPARMGAARLVIVVVAVLLVPGLTLWKLAVGDRVALESVATCSALLSLVVVAYLAGLLREWAKIERRSQHDELTGLPNRRQFHDQLADALAESERSGEHVAVMFLDLDRFKLVNDTLGHAAGNVLLMTVGKRLVDHAPAGAMIARLQGDEFALLIADAVDGVTSLAAANELLEAIGQPVTIAKRKLHVSGSIGIAHSPQDGREPEALLRSADRAMYRAKELGRNRAQLHTADIQAKSEGRFDIESALHGAAGRGELRLLYQPKVDLRTGKVMGAEALLRWQHPEMGTISPVDFIPIAEENGLIVELGEWALLQACEQLTKWEKSGFPELSVSVNLSPRQFQLTRVADVVASVLRRAGTNPARLELELTESLALQDPTMVSATLSDLRALGVECSIDDFGTGWSGLSYLSHFPINALKIDKSFVQGIADDSAVDQTGNQASIVLAIIAMAKGLNLRVVAEGVETPAQLYFLLRNGCDQMQGNLFSPPVTAERFEQLVMLERVAGGQGRLRLAETVPA